MTLLTYIHVVVLLHHCTAKVEARRKRYAEVKASFEAFSTEYPSHWCLETVSCKDSRQIGGCISEQKALLTLTRSLLEPSASGVEILNHRKVTGLLNRLVLCTCCEGKEKVGLAIGTSAS